MQIKHSNFQYFQSKFHGDFQKCFLKSGVSNYQINTKVLYEKYDIAHWSSHLGRRKTKNHAKIVLMLLFDHYVLKTYQKVQSCINLRAWTKGFHHSL